MEGTEGLLAAGTAHAHTGHAAPDAHWHPELWLLGVLAVAAAAWLYYRKGR